jgi:hypothetical protein
MAGHDVRPESVFRRGREWDVSRKSLATALAFCAALSGCAGDTTGPETQEEIAVFGYLYVGEAVNAANAIYVTRTRPIDETYDPDEAAVSGALVTLRDAAGGELDTLQMGEPGRYYNSSVVIGAA